MLSIEKCHLVKKPVVLLAEGDDAQRRGLREILLRHGYEVIEAFDRTSLFQSFQTGRPDLVITGSWENCPWKALEVAQEIRRQNQSIPCILIAKESSEDLAIAALRTAINDYFRKPFSDEELLTSIKRCLADRLFDNGTAECELNACERLVGENLLMRAVKKYILKLSATNSTVLITGETGTGKELVAELIHKNSARNKRRLVCINCAALPDSLLESELFGHERGAFTGAVAAQQGKLELADEGTIFLDEISEMSLFAQAKILRAIESREIYRVGGRKSIPLSMRIIAATNRDPQGLIAEKKFREDLYFRLNIARIHLPSLRDRKEDIPLLLEHYVQKMNRLFGRIIEGFTEEVLEYLLYYDWPGNVRELKNLCEAIFINQPSRRITFHDLPELFQRLLKDSESLSKNERDRLLSALHSTKWNVSNTARKLHWSRMTIYRKIEKYQIKKPCPLAAPHEATLPGEDNVTAHH